MFGFPALSTVAYPQVFRVRIGRRRRPHRASLSVEGSSTSHPLTTETTHYCFSRKLCYCCLRSEVFPPRGALL